MTTAEEIREKNKNWGPTKDDLTKWADSFEALQKRCDEAERMRFKKWADSFEALQRELSEAKVNIELFKKGQAALQKRCDEAEEMARFHDESFRAEEEANLELESSLSHKTKLLEEAKEMAKDIEIDTAILSEIYKDKDKTLSKNIWANGKKARSFLSKLEGEGV